MKITCPTCHKVIEDVAPDFPPRPFCSARCKLVDLNNWLSESYNMPRPLTAEDLDKDRNLN